MISDLGKIVGKYEIKWILALLTQAALNTALLTGFSSQAWAQETILQGSPARDGGDLCDAFDPLPCIRRVGQDEVGLTRSLFHPTRRSLSAILGVTAATGVALHFDKQMSKTLMGLPGNPTQINRAADITGVYAPFAAGGLMYLTGSFLHNSHARETGMLATEAMVDGALIGQGLKFVVNRSKPGDGSAGRRLLCIGCAPRGQHAVRACDQRMGLRPRGSGGVSFEMGWSGGVWPGHDDFFLAHSNWSAFSFRRHRRQCDRIRHRGVCASQTRP